MISLTRCEVLRGALRVVPLLSSPLLQTYLRWPEEREFLQKRLLLIYAAVQSTGRLFTSIQAEDRFPIDPFC